MSVRTSAGRLAGALAAALALLCLAPAAFAAEPPERSITELRDGIFRMQNGNHFSIFIVGPQSILATDPINAEAAAWLRAELAGRFGDRPIKYMVYSHNHPDHVSGGEALADPDTLVVAHHKAAEDLRRNQVPTAYPTVTFSERMWLDLDGRAIQLAYHGPNNGVGGLSLYVPDAKFLFVVDWIVLKRLPARDMYFYDFEGMIDSIKDVLHLDFDLVSPGHSVVGDKDDVREFLNYLETLRDEVLAGLNAGKTLEQMQAEITLDRFSHWGNFEWRPLNIQGAYDQLVRTSARFGQAR